MAVLERKVKYFNGDTNITLIVSLDQSKRTANCDKGCECKTLPEYMVEVDEDLICDAVDLGGRTGDIIGGLPLGTEYFPRCIHS